MKTIKIMMMALMMCFAMVSCGPTEKEIKDKHDKDSSITVTTARIDSLDKVIKKENEILKIMESTGLDNKEAEKLYDKRNAKK